MSPNELNELREAWENATRNGWNCRSTPESVGRATRSKYWVAPIIYGNWELLARIMFSRRNEPVVENVLEIRQPVRSRERALVVR